MKLARVIGQMVSTIKDERHANWKLLLVQPVDDRGVPYDRSLVAIDSVQAGVGDYVLVCQEGKSARQVMRSKDAPVEAIIVGVVDHLLCGGAAHRLRPPASGEEVR